MIIVWDGSSIVIFQSSSAAKIEFDKATKTLVEVAKAMKTDSPEVVVLNIYILQTALKSDRERK